MRSRNGAAAKAPLAVYPGSFDPVTYGHLDIVRRAARCFPRLLVAVVSNPNKRAMFTLRKRVDLLREACDGISNVDVDCFSGLLVDFVRQRGAQIIVKG